MLQFVMTTPQNLAKLSLTHWFLSPIKYGLD